MTNFERNYLLNKQPKIAIGNRNKLNEERKCNDITTYFQKQRDEYKTQMQYRKLDILATELEKEIQAIKALRMEMEKYKIDFTIDIEDEATKKIQEVIEGINKIFK